MNTIPNRYQPNLDRREQNRTCCITVISVIAMWVMVAAVIL